MAWACVILRNAFCLVFKENDKPKMNALEKEALSSNSGKKKRVPKKEPRPAASQHFYDLFLRERRPKTQKQTGRSR